MNPKQNRCQACILTLVLLILCIVSCISIYVRYRDTSQSYTAYIYQNGNLIQSIDLSTVTESYTFTVSTQTGLENCILVQPGGISITQADCPDQVCVSQGIIRNSLLPITCLPHGLVIELHANTAGPDTVTY